MVVQASRDPLCPHHPPEFDALVDSTIAAGPSPLPRSACSMPQPGRAQGGGIQVTMKLVFVSARPVLIVAKEMALLTTPTPSAS
jgi:hypothetical protein